MYRSLALSLCTLIFASAALSADATGTWKLNTAKSKYTGMPAPKELTAVYTPEGSGWRYEATGMDTAGNPIKSSFTYVKDGADISTTGFPNWDTIVIHNGAANKSTVTLKRKGKKVGRVTRVIAADNKTMTLRGHATTADGKKVSYVAVYEKQ